MKPPAMFDLSIRHKPWRPSHLRQLEQGHRAQDACRKSASGCVAAGWTFESGWQPASNDATGWLIGTLLPTANYLAWPNMADRACAMLYTQSAKHFADALMMDMVGIAIPPEVQEKST